MATEILNELLAGDISADDVIAWLTLGNPIQGSKLLQQNPRCSRGDFILHFLNYLRKDTSSILKQSNVGCTPRKATKCTGENEKPSIYLSPKENNVNKITNNRRVELFPCGSNSRHTCRNDKLESNEKHSAEEATSRRSQSTESNSVNKNILVQQPNDTTRHAEIQDNCNSSTKTRIALTKVEPVTPNNKCSQYLKAAQFLSPTERPEYPQPIFTGESPLSKNSGDLNSPSHTPGRITRLPKSITLSDYIIKENSTNVIRRRGNKYQTNNQAFSDVNEENVKSVKSQKRRIKPTRLIPSQNEKAHDNESGDQQNADFGIITRPIEPSTPFREVRVLEKPESSSKSFQQERDLLRRERQKQQISSKVSEDDAKREGCAPVPIALQSLEIRNPSLPLPDLVTCHDQLDSVASVYSSLFRAGLLPNVTSEMNFITSLIVSEEGSGEECENSYFNTIHNCVFFAAAVLNQLRSFLEILDIATLQLLVSNKVVELFAPDLHKHLQIKLQERDAEERLKSPKNDQSFVDNVTYRPDEDSRDNFPTDQAFFGFRKQRDAFYEVWQIWETEHNQHNWSFSVALGARIRSLLALHRDPSNYVHLARLFRLQLLTSCRVSESEHVDDNIDDSMLASLKDINPKKYALLRARLVAPSKGCGPCPPPIFPGHQEFFKKFLLEALDSVFNKHLSDGLAHELISLDCAEFSASDVGDTDTYVDENTRKEFQKCLCTARLLAKFLGFINFLPYHTVDNIPDKISILYISIRSKMMPPFDVLSALQGAVHSHRIVLTVPWAVKYLAMLDAVSLRLPYYVSVLRLLFSIHRYQINSLPEYSALLLRLCLGWLFDQPNFPDGLFFSWLSEQEAEGVPKELAVSSPLDSLYLVDEDCVYTCCPYLGVLRTTLAEDPHTKSHRSLRHITPVSANLGREPQATSTKQLELQLEESFFHGHPASVKKTVEFVAERVASAFVKHICNKLLPQQKKDDADKINAVIVKSTNTSAIQISQEKTQKEKATRGVEEIARIGSELLAKQAVEEVESFCSDRIMTSMSALLAEDVAQKVVEACAGISLRLCKDRVSSWVQLHLTPDLFVKDYQMEVNKAFRSSRKTEVSSVSHFEPSEIQKVCHDDATVTPCYVISQMREILWRLMTQYKDPVFASEIISLICETEKMLGNREDIISSAERTIYSLLLDILFILVSQQPKEVTTGLVKCVFRLLESPQLSAAHVEGRMERILSPRNVAIMLQSKQPDLSWDRLTFLLSTLLRERVMMPNQLEDQCVALLRHTWRQETLDRFSSCIKNVVQTYRKENQNAYDKFVLLMELISELCDDMENFGEF